MSVKKMRVHLALFVVLVILVKNSFELVCYSCASSIDARCQIQMTAYGDLQQTCPSPNSSCTSIISTATGFETTVIRGCQVNCVASTNITATQSRVVTCCSTDLCNLNIASTTTTATTTNTLFTTNTPTTTSTISGSTITTTTAKTTTIWTTTTTSSRLPTSTLIGHSNRLRFGLFDALFISTIVSFFLLI